MTTEEIQKKYSIDAGVAGSSNSREAERQKLLAECQRFKKSADTILSHAKAYKKKYGNADWSDVIWQVVKTANGGSVVL